MARLGLGLGLGTAPAGDGGGGGGVPAWVEALRAPSNDLPTLAFDFKNTRYWDGTAESTDPLSCLEENTDWGAFDLASIQAGFGLAPTGTGGADNNAAPVVKPSLAAALMASGMTTVVQGLAINNGSSTNNMTMNAEFVELPGYNTEYSAEVICNMNGFTQDQHSNATVINQDDFIQEEPINDTVEGSYRLASIIDLTGVQWAVNGVARTAAVGTVVPANPWNNIGIISFNNGVPFSDNVSPIELVALYPPQPDADLPTLSAL